MPVPDKRHSRPVGFPVGPVYKKRIFQDLGLQVRVFRQTRVAIRTGNSILAYLVSREADKAVRWRIELCHPNFSGEDSLASNKAGAFLP